MGGGRVRGSLGGDLGMIRPARSQDAARLAVLATELGYPCDEPAMGARLAALRGADDAVLVAEVEGAVVGWLHVGVVRTLTADRSAEIHAFVVDEPLRGRGLGGALLEAAEDWARAAGCGLMTVRSAAHRSRTHAFYTRAGYLSVKTQQVFRKSLGGG